MIFDGCASGLASVTLFRLRLRLMKTQHDVVAFLGRSGAHCLRFGGFLAFVVFGAPSAAACYGPGRRGLLYVTGGQVRGAKCLEGGPDGTGPGERGEAVMGAGGGPSDAIPPIEGPRGASAPSKPRDARDTPVSEVVEKPESDL